MLLSFQVGDIVTIQGVGTFFKLIDKVANTENRYKLKHVSLDTLNESSPAEYGEVLEDNAGESWQLVSFDLVHEDIVFGACFQLFCCQSGVYKTYTHAYRVYMDGKHVGNMQAPNFPQNPTFNEFYDYCCEHISNAEGKPAKKPKKTKPKKKTVKHPLVNGEHDFEKTNLYTESDKIGTYDRYKCKNCGVEGKRRGIGSQSVEALDVPCNQPVKRPILVKTVSGSVVGVGLSNNTEYETTFAPKEYEHLSGVWVHSEKRNEPVRLTPNEYVIVKNSDTPLTEDNSRALHQKNQQSLEAIIEAQEMGMRLAMECLGTAIEYGLVSGIIFHKGCTKADDYYSADDVIFQSPLEAIAHLVGKDAEFSKVFQV